MRALKSPGAVSRQWLLPLAITLLMSNLIRLSGATHTGSHCAQFGQGNDDFIAGGHTGILSINREGPWSIGARKFNIKYDYLDVSWYRYPIYYDNDTYKCPYTEFPHYTGDQYIRFDPCPGDAVEMRAYAVEQNGVVMNGWLHFEIELKTKTTIEAIYVQTRDEFYNAVGEFVNNPAEQCPPVTPGLSQPSEYQILPCSALGAREAKVATAIFMMRPEALVDKKAIKYLPDECQTPNPGPECLSKGIHFTWRMGEYWCNRHLRLRLDALILTKEVVDKKKDNPGDPPAWAYNRAPKTLRKATEYWLHPRWYGAADIKLPHTNMTCDQQVIDYKTGKMLKRADGSPVAPWLSDLTTQNNIKLEYFLNTSFDVRGVISVCAHPIRERKTDGYPVAPGGYVKDEKDRCGTYCGRCVNDTTFRGINHNNLQACNLNVNAPEFKDFFVQFPNAPTYSNYVNQLVTNRSRFCNATCVLPTAQDLPDIKALKDNSDESYYYAFTKYSDTFRQDAKLEKFFVGRKYHGSMCTAWTIFLIPVGLFCARYMKETCMQITCTGVHFWYWVHLSTSILAVGVAFSSMTSLWINVGTWGRSLHPASGMHRIFGYGSITLFCLMLVLGCLRGLNTKHRLVAATLHSVIGFLIYFFNIFAIISSGFIPASPSMSDCDEEGNGVGFSPVLMMTIIWVVIDVVLHIAMTVLQIFKDREVGMLRPWYCPIIPVMPIDAADDFIGASLRKIMMCIYGAAAFVMTSSIVSVLNKSQLSERCQGLPGPFTCESKWGCSRSAMKAQEQIMMDEVIQNATYAPLSS